MPTSAPVRPAAFLVDLDGTVADTLPVVLAAFRASLVRHTGRDWADGEIASYFGSTEEGMARRMVPAAWEACLATYLEEYERAHHLCPAPFPGISELLRSLRRRGVRVGAASFLLRIIPQKGSLSKVGKSFRGRIFPIISPISSLEFTLSRGLRTAP